MYMDPNCKYQIKIEFNQNITSEIADQCNRTISDNLDFLNILKCQIFSQTLEIIFNPPEEFNDKFIFEQIDEILQNASLIFAKALLRQYVGNAARTLTASILGGSVGSRGGAAGTLLGLIGGAVIEKALFDWKNLCECTHDEFGNLVINRVGGN